MPDWTFRLNSTGVDEALRSREIGSMLDDAAEQIADEITRTAPSGESFHGYAGGIGTRRATRSASGDLEAEVYVESAGWHLVEYGSVYTAPRATIGRAARSVLRSKFEER